MDRLPNYAFSGIATPDLEAIAVLSPVVDRASKNRPVWFLDNISRFLDIRLDPIPVLRLFGTPSEHSHLYAPTEPARFGST